MASPFNQPIPSTHFLADGDISLTDFSEVRSGSQEFFSSGERFSDSPRNKLLLGGEGTPKASWLSLFAFTSRRHLAVLSAAILLSTASGLVLPCMSVLIGKTFGTFAGLGSGTLNAKEFAAQASVSITYLTLLGCGSWLLHGAFFASWLWFGELQAKAARDQLFESLIEKELCWFEERKDGVSATISKSQTYVLSRTFFFTFSAFACINPRLKKIRTQRNQ